MHPQYLCIRLSSSGILFRSPQQWEAALVLPARGSPAPAQPPIHPGSPGLGAQTIPLQTLLSIYARGIHEGVLKSREVTGRKAKQGLELFLLKGVFLPPEGGKGALPGGERSVTEGQPGCKGLVLLPILIQQGRNIGTDRARTSSFEEVPKTTLCFK